MDHADSLAGSPPTDSAVRTTLPLALGDPGYGPPFLSSGIPMPIRVRVRARVRVRVRAGVRAGVRVRIRVRVMVG